MLTVRDLVADLRQLGLAAGDVVMVHASLRAIGAVDGRAAAVVAALDEAVGASGTVIMGLGARDDWGWINDEPEDTRLALLAEAEPFDPLQTPADPAMGVLAEVFRRTPGTRVSNHPEGRFGARGQRAQSIVADVPWDHYYGPGSPLERLVELRGKVLRLGADLDTVTLIHYAEYLVPLAGKRTARRYRALQTAHGVTVRTVDCLDDAQGIVDCSGPDYFELILEGYLATGRGTRGRVGAARSELVDAGDLVDFAVSWMAQHFGPG